VPSFYRHIFSAIIHVGKSNHRSHNVEKVLNTIDIALLRMFPQTAVFMTLREIENGIRQIV
jgi:hypothetical protein